jgi:hypothetical protein
MHHIRGIAILFETIDKFEKQVELCFHTPDRGVAANKGGDHRLRRANRGVDL